MDGFKLFWEAYPNAQGVFPAMTAYVHAIRDDGATEQEIIDGAREYRKYVQQNKIEQRYIKYPSNWLQQGHYYNRYDVRRCLHAIWVWVWVLEHMVEVSLAAFRVRLRIA